MTKMQWLEHKIKEMRSLTKDDDLILTLDTNLEDLELDSLDIVELQMDYEDSYNTILEDSDVELITIADLLNLMK